MASAYTALANDISYFDANPAGSSRLANTDLAFSHHQIIADANLEGLAFSHRIEDLGFGAALRILHVPFTQYDNSGIQSYLFRYVELIGILNVSYNLFNTYDFHGLSIGANVKVAARPIPSPLGDAQSSASILGDAGVLTGVNFLKPFVSDDPNLTFGAALKNIGTFDNGNPPPSEVNLGISYSLIKPLTLSFDLGLPFSLSADFEPSPIKLSGGAKISIDDIFDILTGVSFDAGNTRFTVGAKLNLNTISLNFNYSIDASTRFDQLDRFNAQVVIHLGDGGRAERRSRVVNLYLQGLSALISGDYETAIRLSEQALALDSDFRPAAETRELAIAAEQDLNDLLSLLRGDEFVDRYAVESFE